MCQGAVCQQEQSCALFEKEFSARVAGGSRVAADLPSLIRKNEGSCGQTSPLPQAKLPVIYRAVVARCVILISLDEECFPERSPGAELRFRPLVACWVGVCVCVSTGSSLLAVGPKIPRN